MEDFTSASTVRLTEMSTAVPTEVMTHPVVAHITHALTPTPGPPHTEATEAFAFLTDTTTGSYIIAPLPAANSDDGSFEAIIGGVIVAVLLVLVCVGLVMLYYMTRQKGSYVTHEMDKDEESFDSHTALQADTYVDKVEQA